MAGFRNTLFLIFMGLFLSRTAAVQLLFGVGNSQCLNDSIYVGTDEYFPNESACFDVGINFVCDWSITPISRSCGYEHNQDITAQSSYVILSVANVLTLLEGDIVNLSPDEFNETALSSELGYEWVFALDGTMYRLETVSISGNMMVHLYINSDQYNPVACVEDSGTVYHTFVPQHPCWIRSELRSPVCSITVTAVLDSNSFVSVHTSTHSPFDVFITESADSGFFDDVVVPSLDVSLMRFVNPDTADEFDVTHYELVSTDDFCTYPTQFDDLNNGITCLDTIDSDYEVLSAVLVDGYLRTTFKYLGASEYEVTVPISSIPLLQPDISISVNGSEFPSPFSADLSLSLVNSGDADAEVDFSFSCDSTLQITDVPASIVAKSNSTTVVSFSLISITSTTNTSNCTISSSVANPPSFWDSVSLFSNVTHSFALIQGSFIDQCEDSDWFDSMITGFSVDTYTACQAYGCWVSVEFSGIILLPYAESFIVSIDDEMASFSCNGNCTETISLFRSLSLQSSISIEVDMASSQLQDCDYVAEFHFSETLVLAPVQVSANYDVSHLPDNNSYFQLFVYLRRASLFFVAVVALIFVFCIYNFLISLEPQTFLSAEKLLSPSLPDEIPLVSGHSRKHNLSELLLELSKRKRQIRPEIFGASLSPKKASLFLRSGYVNSFVIK